MNALKSGDRLDHYEIEDVAASGGMATIFRGIDTRTGRKVAIKVPLPQAEMDPVFFDRFHREIEIGKKLEHPSIVKIIDDPDRSRLYMAMEWANGALLRELLATPGGISGERAIAIALQICDALEYMHSRGVVHRDLKPENILVNDADEIKIIDFGIASTAGARRLTFGKLTEVMGSPDYISPEQVKGSRGDARSDLYALGVMLYEMLVGRTPFSGANAFAIMHDRMVNHPPPPREIAPGISPELQEIIYRAMERDPRNRYGSAREFSLDLQHPERVGIEDRREMREWRTRRSPLNRRILSYVMLALLPLVVFGMLLYVAQHS
jgi:serine/threonine-protein kinase